MQDNGEHSKLDNDKPFRGDYTFTHYEEAESSPDMSAGSIASALPREVSKGRIMSPLRGFYVIVLDEYVLRGAVQQSFYIDGKMCHLGRKYYVQAITKPCIRFRCGSA